MNYIRWFPDIGIEEVGIVGGKGANLGELVTAGLPVPPGFCLSAQAYGDFVEITGLKEKISSLLTKSEMDELTKRRIVAEQIQHLIMEQTLPDSVTEQVRQGYRMLSEDSGANYDHQPPVAIRSSATAEDLPEASFAGQQDTYLNIRGEQAILEHIHLCWASLWSIEAMTYRVEHGYDHLQVLIAVVLQSMIESEVSGVMFTANPLTSNRAEALINSSWGLGEAVVSGIVTPDQITVGKSDGAITDYQIGGKQITIEYAPDGGILELNTPETRQKARSLSEDQVLDLARLADQVESHYGSPQDIEWAYATGKFYLLQSRPITTLTPAASAAGNDEFNRTMFIEIFPDPLSPLFLSVMGPMIESMLDFTFRSLGFTPKKSIEAIGVFYNQPYFNQFYIASALDPLKPSTRDRLVSLIVNPFGKHDQGVHGEFSWAYIKMILSVLRFMIYFPRRLPGLIEGYRVEVEQMQSMDLQSLSDEEIISRVRNLVFGTASDLLSNDFLLIALTGIMYQMLGTLLSRYYEEDTEEIRSKLISGVTGNATMETNIQLWDLAQKAKASHAVAAVFRSYSTDERMDRLAGSDEGRAFVDELNHFLREYGHREIRMDILYPTWGEDPSPVLDFIQSYLDVDERRGPHSQQEKLIQQRREMTHDVKEKVRSDFIGKILYWPIFKWVLGYTQTHTRERDTMHFELTRLFPPFRRLFLELGDRWTKSGILPTAQDIFFLGLSEFDDLLLSSESMTSVVEARRSEYELNKTRAWPDIIVGDEEIYGEASAVEIEDGAYQGVAGSPGIVSGVARVILGPEDFSRLNNGEILIAPLTNPVWTPLFAIAGGVVTEVGGILSHGAIVAREYGIPAVLSIAGATSLIKDGEQVLVNGNQGTIKIQEGVFSIEPQ